MSYSRELKIPNMPSKHKIVVRKKTAMPSHPLFQHSYLDNTPADRLEKKGNRKKEIKKRVKKINK